MKLVAKIVTVALVICTSSQAMASQYDVYIRFKDGTSKVYSNRTDGPNALQHLALDIQRDFPNKPLTELATVDSVPAGQTVQQAVQQVNAYHQANAEDKTSFWDSTAGTVTKGIIGVVALAALWKMSAPIAASGVCDYTWQTASNGSRCGNRAAIVRPGGKF